MKRIYHPYWKWEDWKCGFYDNMSGTNKKEKIEKVIEMFGNEKKTREMMFRVVDEWRYSCEQNLSNSSINKIAYIGQGACCLYDKIPSTVTMEAWSLLDKEIRDRSDGIAKEAIERWSNNNKFIQLCLNID